MRTPKTRFFISALFLSLMLTAHAWAMTAAQQEQFDGILNMTMAKLTEASEALLEKKYPDEDWDEYNFPSFVFTSDSVEVGYKIAVKEPDLLGQTNLKDKNVVIPCYCFCDAMGHDNLLYCFLKEGKLEAGFDDHASGCNICYGQAMQAFLWNDLGATHDEIIAGMEKKYQRLIQMKKDGKF
ncbi:PCYCGC motif-containing (lipo)protein [Trichloromonas sp.]|uniref:PCYCGC motif-containing (lipo)protein n=1 Tax=Trichloromonas sp. TaxID=3069249 RepID=UPI003D818304